MLHNSYVLGNEMAFGLQRFYNDKLCGLSLLGVVIDTVDETVRLHLDIDKTQEKDKAYLYPFTPQQGNVMYCMPQHGTKAYLKMSSHNDGDSVVEHCHRTNGLDCGDMGDYNNRYFTTEFGKRMAMLPELMYFQAESNMVSLQDKSGIGAITGKQINMQAHGRIQFSSQGKITFETPEQVILAKTGAESGFEISGSKLNILSKNIYLKGNAGAQAAAAPDVALSKTTTMPRELALSLAAMIPLAASINTLGA